MDTKMPSGRGDLGTRSSEKALNATGAGKSPTISEAFNGAPPHLGKACKHLSADVQTRSGKDCM